MRSLQVLLVRVRLNHYAANRDGKGSRPLQQGRQQDLMLRDTGLLIRKVNTSETKNNQWYHCLH